MLYGIPGRQHEPYIAFRSVENGVVALIKELFLLRSSINPVQTFAANYRYKTSVKLTKFLLEKLNNT